MIMHTFKFSINLGSTSLLQMTSSFCFPTPSHSQSLVLMCCARAMNRLLVSVSIHILRQSLWACVNDRFMAISITHSLHSGSRCVEIHMLQPESPQRLAR